MSMTDSKTFSAAKTPQEAAEEQRKQAIAAMRNADGRPPVMRSDGRPDTPTVWARADNLIHALADISDHCRRTANDLERQLMELERMLGAMPKRS